MTPQASSQNGQVNPLSGNGGKARYIMIGGFLGAGKTTAVARLAEYLTAKGCKVGLITNDQGKELVDTNMLKSKGFATEEIEGGCFCCRFNSLTEAAAKLTRSSRPDVFIAEPVGSCTDLVATVSYPLRRMYGDDFTVAPLSVVVDPIRAARIYGVETGPKFSEKVVYIYRKQLEEADIIVINKCDLLDETRTKALVQKLQAEFPKATLEVVSARKQLNLEKWFERILTTDQRLQPSMEVDYEIYADGEALLGWLNCTVQFSSAKYFDGNKLLRELAEEVQTLLAASKVEIAHLKMTLNPDYGLSEIGVVNLVRNDFVPELSEELPEPIDRGQLILNLRAEGKPDHLYNAVSTALTNAGAKNPSLFARLEHIEHFKPGKPTPTHRITNINL